jgi:hypothetical protein
MCLTTGTSMTMVMIRMSDPQFGQAWEDVIGQMRRRLGHAPRVARRARIADRARLTW